MRKHRNATAVPAAARRADGHLNRAARRAAGPEAALADAQHVEAQALESLLAALFEVEDDDQ